MTYGLEVWNASGQKTLSTSDGIARLISSHTVSSIAAGGSQSFTVSGMDTSGDWVVFGSFPLGVYTLIGSGSFTVHNGWSSAYSTPFTAYVFRKNGPPPSGSGWGFYLLNDAGGVQIDQDYRNFVLIASGTGVASGSAVTDPYPSIAKAVYVRPTNATGSIQIASSAAGTFSVQTNGTGNWDWAIFAEASLAPSPPNTHGLRVFDASGLLVFDSSQTPLHPLATVTAALGGSTTNATLPTASGGRRPYVGLGNLQPTGIYKISAVAGKFVSPRVTFNSATSMSIQEVYLTAGPPTNLPFGTQRNIDFIEA